MAIKTYPKGSRGKLSKNFSAYEFDCECGRCTETKVDEKLVEYLQQIRDITGKKVHITGPFRCPAHNAEVPNASKTSKHMLGMAADIKVEDTPPAEVAKIAESIGVLGIGLYDTFVHIDTRTKKSFWYSHKQEKRTTFGGAPKYTREQFVRDVQAAIGAAVDGKPGAETISKTVTVSAKINRSHAVVEPVQKRLLALGYEEVGEADDIAGAKFTSALAHFQQDNGCTITGMAEEWGKTWHKLLGMA